MSTALITTTDVLGPGAHLIGALRNGILNAHGAIGQIADALANIGTFTLHVLDVVASRAFLGHPLVLLL